MSLLTLTGPKEVTILNLCVSVGGGGARGVQAGMGTTDILFQSGRRKVEKKINCVTKRIILLWNRITQGRKNTLKIKC